MKCPFCGTDNPAGETFCANCGSYLQDDSANDQTIVGKSVLSDETTDAATINPASVKENAQNTDDRSTSTTSTTGSQSTISTTLHPTVQLQKGRYIVEKILGQGGMGAAVLARDTRIANKTVVIKELISDENDPQQRQEDVNNFKREVETLATLDHPLIPTVTDSFQEGSRYYMVQEYAPGENLEDYMERVQKPMSEQEALTYISQVLDILDYLGQQKPPIIHRDIKPANIIISSRDKRARLVDFGIARADEAKHAKHKQTSALGTPGYAPPEQYQGNADTRSDLYALAATLHHLITHRDPRDYPPFNYPSARSLNPAVSPDLDQLLEHALMIDIGKRYQSAIAMKADVDKILQNRFHTMGDTSSYVLNPSRPITPPPPPVQERTATRPPQSYGPVTPEPGRYQRPSSPYRSSPSYESYDGNQEQEIWGSRQRQQQQQQQQQMGAYAPPRYRPRRQQDSNSYMLWSFLFLVVVVVIIAAIFFLLPLLSGGPYPIL